MSKQTTILAIDDDEDILYTLDQICQYQSWTALLASDFYQAKAHLGHDPVDLVLVDYHMPGMDGVAAVREIRKKLPRVPIIVLTVEERSSIMEKFMEAGASDYSLKPIKAVDLISRIKVHLQYQSRSQYYESHDKGISQVTLQTVEAFLAGADRFVMIEEIEEETGIKQKTVYRYLRYLVQRDRVEVQYTYQGTGRPKTAYKLRR